MRKAAVRGPSINITEFERRLRSPSPVEARESDPFEELERMLYGDAGAPAEPGRLDEEEISLSSSASSTAWISHAAEPSYREDDAFGHERLDSFDDAFLAAAQIEQPYERETDYHDQYADWPQDDGGDYLDFGMQEEEQKRSAQEKDQGDFRFPKVRPWHAALGVAALAIASAGITFAHYSGGGRTTEIASALMSDKSAIAEDRGGSAPARVATLKDELPKPQPADAAPVDAPHQPNEGFALTPHMVKSVQVQPEAASRDNDPPPGSGADQALTSSRDPEPNSADENTGPASTAASAGPPAGAHEEPARRKATKVAPALESEDDAPARSGGRGSLEVRFGSADTAEQARKLMEQIATKHHSQFGGHSLSYRHARVDGNKVYVVRLRGNIGRDAASRICERVTSSGGNCTIAEK